MHLCSVTDNLFTELLMVSRSLRIIQAANQSIGSPVNRLQILASSAAAALISSRPPLPSTSTLSTRTSYYLSDRAQYVRFKVALWGLGFVFQTSALYRWIKNVGIWTLSVVGKGDGTKDDSGFEDDLEKQVKRMAKDEFGVELQG